MPTTPYRRYVNITIQLQDGRILLLRKNKNTSPLPGWGITTGKSLGNKDVMTAFNDIMRETFGINTEKYEDTYAEMIKLPIETIWTEKIILMPFFVKMNTILKFKTKAENEFHALPWRRVLNDIMAKTIYPKNGEAPLHTEIAVQATRVLQEKGTINE